MSVAEVFGAKSDTVSHLAPKALYELASAEADVRAEVERRIAAGEIVTAAEVLANPARPIRARAALTGTRQGK
jgi:hypothetical protein